MKEIEDNVRELKNPYAFIAMTYLIIGDIDTGFSYIYNAIKDDIELGKCCPELNYPANAPAYWTASLNPNLNNIMTPFVKRIRSWLEEYLRNYNNVFRDNLTMEDIDKKFLQNNKLEIIKYYFVFTCWAIYEHKLKIYPDMIKNDFSNLRITDWLFALCLVIDKLFHNHNSFKDSSLSVQIRKYAGNKKLMKQCDFEKLLSQKIKDKDPDKLIPELISNSLTYNDSIVDKKIQHFFIAYNLRNFAAHKIETQNVIIEKFDELLNILFCDIFLIIKEY